MPTPTLARRHHATQRSEPQDWAHTPRYERDLRVARLLSLSTGANLSDEARAEAAALLPLYRRDGELGREQAEHYVSPPAPTNRLSRLLPPREEVFQAVMFCYVIALVVIAASLSSFLTHLGGHS